MERHRGEEIHCLLCTVLVQTPPDLPEALSKLWGLLEGSSSITTQTQVRQEGQMARLANTGRLSL